MSLSYRPDYPPTDPSILTTCQYVIPDKSKQYRTSYNASETSGWTPSSSNPIAVQGARMLKTDSGSPRLLFFNSASGKIIEQPGAGATVDVSKVGGYTASTRFWFEQFGAYTIASNKTDATQSRSGVAGAAFANLAGAPKAKFCLSQGNFLFACNYDDGTDTPNGIKWASEGSTTSWTPSDSNTAGNAILRQSPGEIIAGAAIHDILAIWKYNSMYIGRKVGGVGTDKWQFDLLSPKVGCVSQEGWVSTPVGIIFVSPYNGVYKFDGSVPVPIDEGIRNTIYRKIGTLSSVQMSHDEASACVFIWSTSAVFCYNYLTDEWSEPYAASFGNVTFTWTGTYGSGGSFAQVVRDANYEDYVFLGGDANSVRRCHLIIALDITQAFVVNLKDFAGVFTPTFDVPRVRDPKAGPWDDTQLLQITPIFGWDSETQDFAEPLSNGTATIRSRPRMSSSNSTGTTSASLSSDKRFDMNATSNNFVVTYAFTNEAIVLQDFVYKTQIAGSRG